MNHPWRIWSLFALLLSLGVLGLAWLTWQTLELDRAESLARRQADLEERIGLALWRMDAYLMPVLVEEASRPSYAYVATFPQSRSQDGETQVERALSPLARVPSDLVRLHFELAADNSLASPQSPRGEERNWVVARGVPLNEIKLAEQRRLELARRARFETLLARLPEATPELVVQAPPTPVQSASNSIQSINIQGAGQVVETFSQQQLANARPNGGTSNDELGRNNVFQAYASQARPREPLAQAPTATIEGMSRPVWMDGELLLARRVEIQGRRMIQGCWLDWPRLSERLEQQVADVLPGVELRPAEVGETGRTLATLPVRVTWATEMQRERSWSPIRGSLTLAWLGLGIAATAAGVTLASVLALSERRAAFVAAVTHELRTPLTTFRMYAEMLASGMVPDENRGTYLDTLRIEADRLSHLVDNVLQFARLERGRSQPPRESLTSDELWNRVTARLADRAQHAGLRLECEFASAARDARLRIDSGAFEQIAFNLIDNACKYAAHGADSRIHVEVARDGHEVVWRFRDHGPGIPPAGLKRLFQPFSKTVQEAAISAPGVGLGLALSHRLARELGGSLALERSDSQGTVFALRTPVER